MNLITYLEFFHQKKNMTNCDDMEWKYDLIRYVFKEILIIYWLSMFQKAIWFLYFSYRMECKVSFKSLLQFFSFYTLIASSGIVACNIDLDTVYCIFYMFILQESKLLSSRGKNLSNVLTTSKNIKIINLCYLLKNFTIQIKHYKKVYKTQKTKTKIHRNYTTWVGTSPWFKKGEI